MLHYKNRNHKPLVSQTEFFFGRDYNKLYKLDRKYAIEEENLSGFELRLYDKDIEQQKRKEEQKKVWLMNKSQNHLNQLENKISFKLSFNKYNGYRVEYNGKSFETYNYLGNKYILEIFGYNH